MHACMHACMFVTVQRAKNDAVDLLEVLFELALEINCAATCTEMYMYRDSVTQSEALLLIVVYSVYI